MSLDDRYTRYVGRPGWSVDVEVAETDGNRIVDTEGNRYVDLIAGWCTVNAGYGRGEIVQAAQEAADRAAYVRPTYRDERIVDLAETLAEVTPGDLSHTFRAPSGTESVELALKAARLQTGKETIVANRGAYHGHAMGAISLTS
ncbi:MAG: aminotransferase class III-fold pyridoxal phosphate-dependent enzyme, partial [Candidatus Nanohaloarchaea archaeon]